MTRSPLRVVTLNSVLLLAIAAAYNPVLSQGGSGTVQQAGQAAPEKRYTLELSGGAGFTAVNKDKWVGSTPTEWEEAMYQADARLFFAQRGSVQLGAELGYRYFWYYEIPYATYSLSYDVAATRLGGVARIPLTGVVSADVAGALYFFDGYTDPGVSAGLVFMIPAGGVKLPLHLRTDIVLDGDAMMIGSGATLGVAFKF